MTLVILPALLVFATLVALLAEDALPPSPIIAFQMKPISGIMEIVDTRSNQKKKVKKYTCFEIDDSMISARKRIKHPRVTPQKKVSLFLSNAAALISSKNNVYVVTRDMKPTTIKFSKNFSTLIFHFGLCWTACGSSSTIG